MFMKPASQKKLHSWNLYIIGGTAILFSTLFIVAAVALNQVNANNLNDTVYHMKQQYLHDNVNNEITRLNQERINLENDFQLGLATTRDDMDHIFQTDPSNFLPLATDYFNNESRNHLYVYIYDAVTDQVAYSKAWVDTHQDKPHVIYEFPAYTGPIESYFHALNDDFLCHENDSYGDYRLYVGVPKYLVEKKVADMFCSAIYQMTFEDVNTYMWVNKILVPTGGDGYAIRVIHPNAKDTEYVLPLSTNTLDAAGKTTPYLTELNGVMDDDGEVYFTYAFRLLNSQEIGTKLTYAKLYEPYQWVVAMGVYVEDINPFIVAAQSHIITITAILVGTFLLASVGLFTSHYLLIQRVQRHSLAVQTKNLTEEIAHDDLTGARSRKAAVVDLERYFDLYKQTGEEIALMVFDFDYFKQINDNYGHDIGDKILKGVSDVIRHGIRTTDHLYRWGGDEFVITCVGLKSENAEWVAKNQIRLANEYRCEGAEDIHPSLSFGVTYFSPGDQSYQDTIKRADRALYVAKKMNKGGVFLDID